jgi:phosphoribosylformylglycinamidine synthase
MRVAVLVFPGSNCDRDCGYALGHLLGQPVQFVWHKESSLKEIDLVMIPGGFSYGDYLRAGAIARFSPIMVEVEKFAKSGGLVIGICNGFQILVEAGLLPGVLLRNPTLKFICQKVYLRVEQTDTPFTSLYAPSQVIELPIAHGEGRYWADPSTLAELHRHKQVVFRYCTQRGEVTDSANPNGSLENIAGICNRGRNVLGMMPHPERLAEGVLGGEDGRRLFESLVQQMVK